MSRPLHVAVLDDDVGIAEELAPWQEIPGLERLTVLRRHVGDEAELAAAVQGATVLAVMRERTAITAGLLDRLPELKLVPHQDYGTWQSIVLRQMKHLKVEWTHKL